MKAKALLLAILAALTCCRGEAGTAAGKAGAAAGKAGTAAGQPGASAGEAGTTPVGAGNAGKAESVAAKALARRDGSRIVFRKPVPGFLAPRAEAEFFVTDTAPASDENPVDVYGMVAIPGRPPVFLSAYPYEGGQAEIVDAFPAASGKHLFVIARWRQVHRGLGIDGYFYQVRAYRDATAKDAAGFLVAVLDDTLSARFGEGFEGTQEGKSSAFAFKTAESIQARLSGASQASDDAACLKKTLETYRAKSLDVACAVAFANGPGLSAAVITPGNVALYNDLGFLLGEGARFQESVRVLEKVVSAVPGRTVAYLNLADAYWGISDKPRAQSAYRKYRELMTSEGKAAKIPKRVAERARE